MIAQPHTAPPLLRRWGYHLAASCVAATFAVAGIAGPVHAAGSFCDTARATYTGGYHNAYIIMPASSGADGISCTMSRGATGGGVSALQQSLNRCYGENLSVDGQFGPRTQAALARAQQRHGFTRDLGRYTDRVAYSLKFWGISGLRLVCARMDSAVLQ